MVRNIVLNINIIKETSGGYSAICTDLDIASQGETVEEASSNLREAVELYFESAKELKIMDQILEKLGLDEIKEGMNLPNIFKTEMTIKVTA